MTLRRPPTAFSLKPSDVSDLQASLAARGPNGDAPLTQEQVNGGGDGQGKDPQVERERREREEREGRGQRERVMGTGGGAGTA
jgi:hypothetical protein